MTLEKVFGEELRKAREQSGLTQEKLGFESDYHPTYISQLERGLKSPTLKAIVKISAALGIKASDLIARVERRSK